MAFWRKTKTEAPAPSVTKRVSSWFSTHAFDGEPRRVSMLEYMRALPKPQTDGSVSAMDSWDDDSFKLFGDMQTILSGPIMDWYGAQSFIGHQLAGIVAQHWLVNKACSVPARDAVRKGYNIVTEDGDDLDEEAVKLFKRFDRKFRIQRQLWTSCARAGSSVCAWRCSRSSPPTRTITKSRLTSTA